MAADVLYDPVVAEQPPRALGQVHVRAVQPRLHGMQPDVDDVVVPGQHVLLQRGHLEPLHRVVQQLVQHVAAPFHLGVVVGRGVVVLTVGDGIDEAVRVLPERTEEIGLDEVYHVIIWNNRRKNSYSVICKSFGFKDPFKQLAKCVCNTFFSRLTLLSFISTIKKCFSKIR